MVLQEIQGIASAFALGIDRLTTYWTEERKAKEEKNKKQVRAQMALGILPKEIHRSLKELLK